MTKFIKFTHNGCACLRNASQIESVECEENPSYFILTFLDGLTIHYSKLSSFEALKDFCEFLSSEKIFQNIIVYDLDDMSCEYQIDE